MSESVCPLAQLVTQTRFLPVTLQVRRDPLLQLDDLKAVLPCFRALIGRLLRIVFPWFHGEPPFRFGLRYNGCIISRRADRAPGDAGPARSLLGGKDLTGRFFCLPFLLLLSRVLEPLLILGRLLPAF